MAFTDRTLKIYVNKHGDTNPIHARKMEMINYKEVLRILTLIILRPSTEFILSGLLELLKVGPSPSSPSVDLPNAILLYSATITWCFFLRDNQSEASIIVM